MGYLIIADVVWCALPTLIYFGVRNQCRYVDDALEELQAIYTDATFTLSFRWWKQAGFTLSVLVTFFMGVYMLAITKEVALGYL